MAESKREDLISVSYTHLGQQKLDLANAALTAAGQQPRQKKFETVKDTLRKQISSVLYCATSFEDFSDKLMQQYGIAVKESRGCLSYLPAGRAKFIRAKHLGDNYDKAAVLATLQANVERKPKVQSKQDAIGKLIDIQSRMTESKGIGYKRWLTKHNLKIMAQTVKLLQMCIRDRYRIGYRVKYSRIGRSCHSSAHSSSNFCWAFLATMRSSFFKKDSLPS